MIENRNRKSTSRTAKLPMDGRAFRIVMKIIWSFSSFLIILSTLKILRTLINVACSLRST